MVAVFPDHRREQFLEKSLPSSEESERAILGNILIDNVCMAEAAEHLKPEDFYSPLNRRVFAGMLALFAAGKPIDPIFIGEEMKKEGSLESIGGITTITNLSYGLPHFQNLSEYIKTIIEKRQLRDLIRTCNAITSEALAEEEDASKILEYAESTIFTVCENKKQEAKPELLIELYDANIKETERLVESGVQVVGVPTGLKDLDDMTGGHHKGELTLVGARPSMGKSAAAVGMGLAGADDERVVAYFSLEDTAVNTVNRIISRQARLNLQNWRQAKLTTMMLQNARDIRRELEHKRFYLIDKAGMSPAQIFAKARRIYSIHKRLDLVIVDYLQMAQASVTRRNASRVDEVSQISGDLKTMARELDAPVIALSQLSRKCEERTDKRPILSDLRDSGSIEQDADAVIFLYRDEYYNATDENKGIAEFIVAKQRNGPTGTMKAAFLKEWVRFDNLIQDDHQRHL